MASQKHDEAPESAEQDAGSAQDRRAPRRPDAGPRRDRHEGRLRDFARRMLAERAGREGDDEAEREGYVPLEVARDAMASILETGDRAKTEMVRMVAREVRHYLDELQLVEGMEHMLRHYRLEVHASLSLEPKGEDDEGGIKVEAKPKRKDQPKSKSKVAPAPEPVEADEEHPVDED